MKTDFNKICFMGLGYIGLPTAAIVANSGRSVIGVDINEKIVERVNNGEIHISEPGLLNLVKTAIEKKSFSASLFPKISDVYLIVVPTPFKENYEPDISFVIAATDTIVPLLKPGDLYIIESTSPVGTTENIASRIFKKRPELINKISIAYCPERVLPGNVLFELINNDRVVGGIDKESTDNAAIFYKLFIKGEVHKTNSRTAEMCKLVENSSRDVQIAFANELSIICEKIDINIWELINLANMHPRVRILKPGCGVGGHCIAVDPYFIASVFPKEAQLIKNAREVNNYKAFWCVEKIFERINTFKKENGKIPNVALMGLAFKPDIDDLRESPAVKIARKVLESEECTVLISEPNINNHDTFKLVEYKEAYRIADIVVFLVAHTVFKSLNKSTSKTELDFCGIRH
jgi:UDP-N-acetyl-D-mannosaminuronic acid dehydrogenase